MSLTNVIQGVTVPRSSLNTPSQRKLSQLKGNLNFKITAFVMCQIWGISNSSENNDFKKIQQSVGQQLAYSTQKEFQKQVKELLRKEIYKYCNSFISKILLYFCYNICYEFVLFSLQQYVNPLIDKTYGRMDSFARSSPSKRLQYSLQLLKLLETSVGMAHFQHNDLDVIDVYEGASKHFEKKFLNYCGGAPNLQLIIKKFLEIKFPRWVALLLGYVLLPRVAAYQDRVNHFCKKGISDGMGFFTEYLHDQLGLGTSKIGDDLFEWVIEAIDQQQEQVDKGAVTKKEGLDTVHQQQLQEAVQGFLYTILSLDSEADANNNTLQDTPRFYTTVEQYGITELSRAISTSINEINSDYIDKAVFHLLEDLCVMTELETPKLSRDLEIKYGPHEDRKRLIARVVNAVYSKTQKLVDSQSGLKWLIAKVACNVLSPQDIIQHGVGKVNIQLKNVLESNASVPVANFLAIEMLGTMLFDKEESGVF